MNIKVITKVQLADLNNKYLEWHSPFLDLGGKRLQFSSISIDIERGV